MRQQQFQDEQNIRMVTKLGLGFKIRPPLSNLMMFGYKINEVRVKVKVRSNDGFDASGRWLVESIF